MKTLENEFNSFMVAGYGAHWRNDVPQKQIEMSETCFYAGARAATIIIIEAANEGAEAASATTVSLVKEFREFVGKLNKRNGIT